MLLSFNPRVHLGVSAFLDCSVGWGVVDIRSWVLDIGWWCGLVLHTSSIKRQLSGSEWGKTYCWEIFVTFLGVMLAKRSNFDE